MDYLASDRSTMLFRSPLPLLAMLATAALLSSLAVVPSAQAQAAASPPPFVVGSNKLWSHTSADGLSASMNTSDVDTNAVPFQLTGAPTVAGQNVVVTTTPA